MIKPTVKANSLGKLRVELPPYTFSPDEAKRIAWELIGAADDAKRLPETHERHLLLLASCALCVYEARNNPDALTYDERVRERA